MPYAVDVAHGCWINFAVLPNFLIATGRSINKERMKDQYVVLRAMAFLMLHRGEFKDIPALNTGGDIDDFLARFMVLCE